MKDMRKADRRRRTEKVKNRRVRQAHMQWGWFDPEFFSEEEQRRRKGKCRSRSPFDCGRSNCYSCHPGKVGGEKSRLAGEADIDYNEQLKDLD